MTQIPSNLDVGVATHTGLVRTANEDDFLLLMPRDSDLRTRANLLVIADGMGGVSGGAEASRVAVRALGAEFLKGDAASDPAERMAAAFASASEAVHLRSRESLRLRDMGTTLTAVNLLDDSIAIGHVGDTRCLRWRDGELEQLTTDHAVTEPRSYITRCIGAGRASEEMDFREVDLAPDDVIILLSDGVWGVVGEDAIHASLAELCAQDTAETLIRLANEAGGPDNCTALVIRVLSHPRGLSWRSLDLPSLELGLQVPIPPSQNFLRAPRWPWFLIAASLLASGIGILRWVGKSW